MRSRTAPEAARRSYHRALVDRPLLATVPDPPDHRSLTVLGAARIGGRTVAFATEALRPRLWIVTEHDLPHVIGFLTGLVHSRPDLWICDPDAWAWINTDTVSADIKAAAGRVWTDCRKECDR
ncbi:hypothetical protein [Glycomyces xiaoerkulensis]|uniref:hypothetical protein n=1 Tax=Glycomyces xiaoerkulensis TaxID=2038139 RepID=UPI000C257581|nr:hypothetical protein [Glycomyces xiaoerkulensis]